MFLDFVAENWYLFVMLAFILLLLGFQPSGGAKPIVPFQLAKMQTERGAVVVDVESATKYKEGHISDALNLPFDTLRDNLGRLNKHKQKPLIIACRNGALSARAAAVLRKHEFKELYILDGGLNAWRKENLPLVKG